MSSQQTYFIVWNRWNVSVWLNYAHCTRWLLLCNTRFNEFLGQSTVLRIRLIQYFETLITFLNNLHSPLLWFLLLREMIASRLWPFRSNISSALVRLLFHHFYHFWIIKCEINDTITIVKNVGVKRVNNADSSWVQNHFLFGSMFVK